jgi:c-di-GMP-binding flagellar brake protein YcgR
MAEDRRQYKRGSLLLEVIWEAAAGKYEARTGDISAGGCYIDSIGQVALGEIINFKVRLPSGQWIDLQGEVTYQFQGMGFGLRFTQMTDEARTLIAQMTEGE